MLSDDEGCRLSLGSSTHPPPGRPVARSPARSSERLADGGGVVGKPSSAGNHPSTSPPSIIIIVVIDVAIIVVIVVVIVAPWQKAKLAVARARRRVGRVEH